MATIRNPTIVKSDMEGIFGRVPGALSSDLRVADEPKARALVLVPSEHVSHARMGKTLVPLVGGLAIIVALLIASTTIGTGGATTSFASQDDRSSPRIATAPPSSPPEATAVAAKPSLSVLPAPDRVAQANQVAATAPRDEERLLELASITTRPPTTPAIVPVARTTVARAVPRRVLARAAMPATARPETGPCGGHGICDYGDVLAADERLMQAYDRAVDAGLPRSELRFYRNRWSQARQHSQDDPAYTISRYDELAGTLSNIVVVDDMGGVLFER